MDAATDCSICANERAAFTSPAPICSSCRLALSDVVLDQDEELVRLLWKVSVNFSATRQRLQHHERTGAPDVVASVAWGLFVQGLVDEGLIIAAQAIRGGVAADVNSVGASALRVLFNATFQQEDFLNSARSVVLRGSARG